MDEATAHTLKFVDEWMDGDFTLLLQNTDLLRDRVSDVLGYIRRTPDKLVKIQETANGKEYIYPFSKDDLGGITSITLLVLKIMHRMEIDREATKDLDDLLTVSEAVAFGLLNLLTRDDEGESLRSAVALYAPPSDAARAWMKVKQASGGRHINSDRQIRDWLITALQAARAGVKSNELASDAVNNDLTERADSLEGIELAVYEWVNSGKSKDPFGTVWKHIYRQSKKTN